MLLVMSSTRALALVLMSLPTVPLRTVPLRLQSDFPSLPEGLLHALDGCTFSSVMPDQDGDAFMQQVLSWLPEMLMSLDLGDDDDEDDDNFVSASRPWLHTKGYHDVRGASVQELANRVWDRTAETDFLQKGGGTLILLLPQLADDEPHLSAAAAALTAGARQSLNDGVLVTAYHPLSAEQRKRAPLPLLQVFLDDPSLLVDGGDTGLSDAIQML